MDSEVILDVVVDQYKKYNLNFITWINRQKKTPCTISCCLEKGMTSITFFQSQLSLLCPAESITPQIASQSPSELYAASTLSSKVLKLEVFIPQSIPIYTQFFHGIRSEDSRRGPLNIFCTILVNSESDQGHLWSHLMLDLYLTYRHVQHKPRHAWFDSITLISVISLNM